MPMGIQLSTAFAIEFPVSTPHGKNLLPAEKSIIRGKSHYPEISAHQPHSKKPNTVPRLLANLVSNSTKRFPQPVSSAKTIVSALNVEFRANWKIVNTM
jgi:hypothetical protein